MSNPSNILGKYRSYSYHHVLLVCNSTATADLLAESTDITVYQHPIDPELRYKERALFRNKENLYITLIDGTTDARFYIMNASWESVIAMDNYIGDGAVPQSTSMSLEGELSIMEPLGANFLNVLSKSCDYLSTDPVGLIFVLKTIFVGHNEDGTTDMLSTVKPLFFMNYDITAIFDSSGAKYTMSFVGITNGLGKMPQVQQTVSGFSYKFDPSKSLTETLEHVGVKISESYDQYKASALTDYAKTLYEKGKKEGTAVSTDSAVTDSINFFDSKYRKVAYSITAEDYKDGNYKAGNNTNERTENTVGNSTISFGASVSIETIIKKVMSTSLEVVRDSKQNSEGKRYIYKIVSGVNSSLADFTVEYHVKKYEMIMMPYDAAFQGKIFKPEPGQSLEFDYIFTGKNVDIREFDIKMEMGMAFFQIASTTDTIPNRKSLKKGINGEAYKATGANAPASDNKVKRTLTPLFLGSQLKAPQARNTKNPIDSASFHALLNRHAALENVEARMTIFGNPQLLNEMQIPSKELTKQGIEPPEKNKTINPKWMNVPTLVKVNVKMPVDANDVNTEYRDFWYTGYYTLFAVKHIFDAGEFTQELDMLSMPVADELDDKGDDPKKDPPPVTKAEAKRRLSEREKAFNKIKEGVFAELGVVIPTKNADEQSPEQSKSWYNFF